MLQKKPTHICLLALIAVVVGCAGTSPIMEYSAQTQDTARLRVALAKGAIVSPPIGDSMAAYMQTTEDCSSPKVLAGVHNLDDTAEKHDPSRRDHRRSGALKMPLGEFDSLEVDEILIDPGENQSIVLQFRVLLYGAFGPFTSCDIGFNQSFEAGKDYEIIGTFDSHSTCSAVVNELVSSQGKVVREQLAKLTNNSHPVSPSCFVKH